jgi:sugar phosphate isomerase/epimerase
MATIAGIEVGCSTNLLNNPTDVVSCIEALPIEFATIELELEEGIRMALARSDAVARQELATALLQLAALQGRRYVVHAPWYGRELSLCSTVSGATEFARVGLLWALDFAQRIGSPIVTFHPGLHDGQTEAALTENLLTSLEPVAKVADETGITLCMEIMGGRRGKNALLSTESHLRIWRELGVWACLDVPHAASRVRTAAEFENYVDEMLACIGHVHLADTNLGVHRHVPIGMGDIDLTRLLRRLAAGGYRGAAVVEEWNQGHGPEVYLEHALRFVSEQKD